MYDESVTYAEESLTSSGNGLQDRPLPAIPTAIGKQDRLIGQLNESLMELTTLLQPVLQQTEEKESIDSNRDVNPISGLAGTIEENSFRISNINKEIRRLISKLEI